MFKLRSKPRPASPETCPPSPTWLPYQCMIGKGREGRNGTRDFGLATRDPDCLRVSPSLHRKLTGKGGLGTVRQVSPRFIPAIPGLRRSRRSIDGYVACRRHSPSLTAHSSFFPSRLMPWPWPYFATIHVSSPRIATHEGGWKPALRPQ